jgi:hypothetical protein
MLDHQKLPAWLREAAREIENAHRTLDELGAPRTADDGTPITLALRITVLFDSLSNQSGPARRADG